MDGPVEIHLLTRTSLEMRGREDADTTVAASGFPSCCPCKKVETKRRRKGKTEGEMEREEKGRGKERNERGRERRGRDGCCWCAVRQPPSLEKWRRGREAAGEGEGEGEKGEGREGRWLVRKEEREMKRRRLERDDFSRK
ncbi:uncharacterized protein [Solanum lycopersicum]|uniref:uncharacterized protein n=1 Tax=Solanum lycopersicum TaxID=4081 RepID=UPI003748E27D